jgi:putative colanic acid biosysnthesis UDP-glucose lipid carrier transferase
MQNHLRRVEPAAAPPAQSSLLLLPPPPRAPVSVNRLAKSARSAAPAARDPPAVALLKAFLNPTVVVAVLVACMWAHDEAFTGLYLILAMLAFLLSAQVFDDVDLFRSWRRPRLATDGRAVLLGWSIVIAILGFLGYATRFGDAYAREVLLAWIIATPFALLLAHGVARLALNRSAGSKTLARSMVVIGCNELGLELAARVQQDPYLHVEMKGFFDDRRPERLPAAATMHLRGALAEVPRFVREQGVDRIYVSLPMVAQPRIMRLLNDLRDTTASVYFVPDIFVFDLIQARFENVDGIPVVAICESPFNGINGALKRLSDVVIVGALLLITWPLLLAIAAGVRLSSPGPVIFKQRRYGLNGEEIVVYKFRTMTASDDGVSGFTQVRRGDSRVTRFGRLLRATSLDELPQLFNVLQGSMSLVGPRPHAVSVNEQYRRLISGYMIRHKVKPGITGWAQINGFRGGDDLDSMRGRVEHDLEYLRNWSLGIDLWIMLKTVVMMFRDRNAF